MLIVFAEGIIPREARREEKNLKNNNKINIQSKII